MKKGWLNQVSIFLGEDSSPQKRGAPQFYVRPFMRTFGWLILLLVNFGVIAAFAPSMFYGDIVGFVVSALFSAICVLLVVARVQRLPSWGYTVMKILCSFVPVLWIAGALDHGMISGLEFLSLIFVVLLAWGTWRVFLFYVPRPNPAFKRDAKARHPSTLR